jgi:hypothetical protein
VWECRADSEKSERILISSAIREEKSERPPRILQEISEN